MAFMKIVLRWVAVGGNIVPGTGNCKSVPDDLSGRRAVFYPLAIDPGAIVTNLVSSAETGHSGRNLWDE